MSRICTVSIVMLLTGCAAFRCPYDTALRHPHEPKPKEVEWFRAHPEARTRLLSNLTAPELPDNDPSRLLAWSLLKQKALTQAETGRVLNQAFNLTTRPTDKTSWWMFDRRTAPEFVYIRPQMWVYLNDGWVVHAEPADTPGNGVEVHEQSSGTGPFAGPFPPLKDGRPFANEFRLYYKVVRARSMP